MASPRLWWLILGLGVVVLIVAAIWALYPRPIRSASPMPPSGAEKRQRWQGAIQKSLQQGASETAPAPR